MRILIGAILFPFTAAASGQDYENIIPMRQRVQLMESWWQWKLVNVLPAILREQEIEMWMVRNDEGELFFNNEGPVYTSLIPANFEGMTLPSRHVPPGDQETPLSDLSRHRRRSGLSGARQLPGCSSNRSRARSTIHRHWGFRQRTHDRSSRGCGARVG